MKGLLLFPLVFLALAYPANAAPVLGIGEQRPYQLVGDPHFSELSVRHIRLTVPIDATDPGWARDVTDQQLYQARELGLEPLVVFNHSRYPGGAKKLPSLSGYMAYFRAFRERYPWVSQFAPWNEANYVKQKISRHPARLASYYKAMRRECPSCTVLVGSLLDSGDMLGYARAVKKRIGRGPHIWALHNYGDAYFRRDTHTRSLIRLTRSPLWLVEVGGMAIYRGDGIYMSKRKFGEKRQARVLDYISGPLVKRNPKIKRLYIYQWRVGPDVDWDSGLLRPDGNPRPGFFSLTRALKAGRVIR